MPANSVTFISFICIRSMQQFIFKKRICSNLIQFQWLKRVPINHDLRVLKKYWQIYAVKFVISLRYHWNKWNGVAVVCTNSLVRDINNYVNVIQDAQGTTFAMTIKTQWRFNWLFKWRMTPPRQTEIVILMYVSYLTQLTAIYALISGEYEPKNPVFNVHCISVRGYV